MYRLYYKLNDQPFGSEPDTKYFYPTLPHKEAVRYLRSGLEHDNGVIVLSGEKGLGKTTLISLLLEQVDKDQNIVAYIDEPPRSVRELIPMILTALQIPVADQEPKAMVNILRKFINEHTQQDKKVLVMIDEAQELSRDCLEFFRLLTALCNDEKKKFQILLLGTDELNQTLSSAEHEALNKLVRSSHSLQRLSAADTQAYIEHRLKVAGWSGKPTIDDEAFAAIHRKTGGVPLIINHYCDRLLMLGMLLETNQINGQVVASLTEAAIEKLNQLEANRTKKQNASAIEEALVEKPDPFFEQQRVVQQKPDHEKGFEIKSDFFDKPAGKSKSFLSTQSMRTIFAITLVVPLSIYVYENMFEKETSHQTTASMQKHTAPTHAVAEVKQHSTNEHGSSNQHVVSNQHSTGHGSSTHSELETERYVLNEIPSHSNGHGNENEHSLVASSNSQLLDIRDLLKLSGSAGVRPIGDEVSITTTESSEHNAPTSH